eukprot:gene13650-16132_t
MKPSKIIPLLLLLPWLASSATFEYNSTDDENATFFALPTTSSGNFCTPVVSENDFIKNDKRKAALVLDLNVQGYREDLALAEARKVSDFEYFHEILQNTNGLSLEYGDPVASFHLSDDPFTSLRGPPGASSSAGGPSVAPSTSSGVVVETAQAVDESSDLLAYISADLHDSLNAGYPAELRSLVVNKILNKRLGKTAGYCQVKDIPLGRPDIGALAWLGVLKEQME